MRARPRGRRARLERAAQDVDAAIRANPSDARPHSLRAEVFRRRGTIDAAVRSLFDAYALAPGSEGFPRRIAELARAELVERRVFPADEPPGAFARRLEEAGVRTLDDVEKFLTFDRRQMRRMLRLRTLAQTDQTIRALKRARDRIGG